MKSPDVTDLWAFIALDVLDSQTHWRNKLYELLYLNYNELDMPSNEAKSLCLQHMQKLNKEFREIIRDTSKTYRSSYEDIWTFFKHNVEGIRQANRIPITFG